MRDLTNNRFGKWTGYEEISGSYWKQLKSGAKRRELLFDITIQQAWLKFITQNRLCALSGLELIFDNKNQTASLDRIDSSKGYVADNIQWIHKDLNKMKMDLKIDDFIHYCELITKYRGDLVDKKGQ